MFWSLFKFCRHLTGEPGSIVTMSRVTYFILWVHKGNGVHHSQHRKKSGEVFEVKKAGELTGKVEIKSLAVDIACMAIYGPAPSLKRITF